MDSIMLHRETLYPQATYNVIWLRLKHAMLQLKQLLDVARPFDYLSSIERGKILLVGEGNLSFAASLASRAGRLASKIVATTFEAETEWQTQTADNAKRLRRYGAVVRGAVDATKLEEVFSKADFGMIAFQFPNVASREPLYGRNPNHILIRRFLRSASEYLSSGGKIVITTVNSPYYDGVFDMEGAARSSGFAKPAAHPFRFREHPGYSHVNTQTQDESAVEKETNFVTFVFPARKEN